MKVAVGGFCWLASRWRNVWYRLLGVRMDGYCWLRAIEIPGHWECIHLGRGVALDRGVVLQITLPLPGSLLEIGAGTYVNRGTYFDAHQKLLVGENCLIGPHCYFTDANHGREPGAPVIQQTIEVKPVIIGNHVWIGAKCIILPGVTIGDGAVVGAGSIVTRDIPAGALAYGSPARVARFLDSSGKEAASTDV
jgi:acetyltransferase-like isoleucine patch superfamily enzyme